MGVVSPAVPSGLVGLKERVAVCCRLLHQEGILNYSGHVSARVPGQDALLVHAFAASRAAVSAESVLACDFEGRVLPGSTPGKPPIEVFIHTEIYRARPDVLSVVHTHQPMSTIMGVAEQPILPILHVEGNLVERPVPIFHCAELVVNPELGRGAAAALGDHKVCHLQGHGIVSVGQTVQEATIGAVHLERLADANYKIAALGKLPRVIPPNELGALKATIAPLTGRWAYYAELAGAH